MDAVYYERRLEEFVRDLDCEELQATEYALRAAQNHGQWAAAVALSRVQCA